MEVITLLSVKLKKHKGIGKSSRVSISFKFLKVDLSFIFKSTNVLGVQYSSFELVHSLDIAIAQ